MSVENDFLAAMTAAGLAPEKSVNIVADGHLHRYRVNGDKSGSLNGWYVLYVDGVVPAGSFGSWKTGESTTWCAKSENTFTAEEKAAFVKKMQEVKAVRDAEQERVWVDAARKANKLWKTSHDASGKHPYLINKGIDTHKVRQLGKLLVVRAADIDGKVTSLQFISEDGSKRFLTGGKKTGSYFAMGIPNGYLCICEGFATGSSIKKATGYAVAVAFDAGNLPTVAKALREKFKDQDLTIIICADNDCYTEFNMGVSRGMEAAQLSQSLVSIPKFSADEMRDGQPTDFNDLHRLRGLEEVRRVIDETIALGELPVLKAGDAPTQADVSIRLSRKELEKLINDTDDFDVLTGELVVKVVQARLVKPAQEYLLSKIARKAGVPKSSLSDVMKMSGDGNDDAGLYIADAKVAELNEKHAVVPVGGRVLIANREYDQAMHRNLLTFSSRSDFETRYCNQKIFSGGGEVGLGEYWINHINRSQFDGIGFLPGDTSNNGFLNLWSGWGVVPRAGDCGLYLDFVADVICSGNSMLFNYILRWCAHMVQHPQELPETALVFRGKEGAGKNTFISPLEEIVGREHALMLTSMGQVTGRFSGHLANALLVFCNESIWGGDKSAQGSLKSMITDKIQPIESKGRDITQVQNFKRMIFATNENWAVPRGADDRRYVITDVSDSKKGDYAYFKALNDEMENGGTEALMHYLLGIDLKDWSPRDIPASLSEKGWELKVRGLNSIGQWYFECLLNGWLIKADGYSDDGKFIWVVICSAEVLYASYVDYCLRHKVAYIEHQCVLGKQLHAWGINTCRPRADNPTRKLFYKLRSLDESRQLFSQALSIPVSIWADHEDGSVYA